MGSWRLLTTTLSMIWLLATARPCSGTPKKMEKRTLLTDYQSAAAVAVAHQVDGVLIYDEIIKADDSRREVKLGPKSDVRAKGQMLVFLASPPGGIFRATDLPPGSGLKEYFLGALKLKDRKPELMRYFFDHLDSKEETIAADAFQEFLLPAKELMALGKTLPAERIAARLRDPQTDAEHCRLYGILLGGCGTDEHAGLLRRRIGELARTKDWDVSGLLLGYVMLRPKEAWGYAYSLLADGTQPESLRLSALRMAASVHMVRPDLVPAKDLVKGVALLLEDPDPGRLTLLAIEFLREAKAWEQTGQVLDLYKKSRAARGSFVIPNPDAAMAAPEHTVTVTVRFALQSPQPRAVAFIETMRADVPGYTREVERKH